ncbi:hypothetical protein Q1J55_21285 [Pseudomonas syringae]
MTVSFLRKAALGIACAWLAFSAHAALSAAHIRPSGRLKVSTMRALTWMTLLGTLTTLKASYVTAP